MEQTDFESPKFDDKAEENNQGNRELLTMTVEIGDGRQDIIAIHENDDPADLARVFADKHGLDDSLMQSLINLIQENKDIIKRKEQGELGSLDWMASHSMSPSNQLHEHKNKTPKKPKKGTVYDRIYQQLKKNNTSVTMQTSQMSKSKSSGTFNYGEYLYMKGLKKKEECKKAAELKQQAKEDSEIPELTFSPNINRNSSMISPRNADKPEEKLWKKGQEYKEKLEKLKQAQEDDEMKECKFTPNINAKSKKKDKSKKIYEKLYDMAEMLKEKQLKVQEVEQKQYTFKPDVSLTKKKGIKETKEEFFDRLDSAKKAYEQDLDRIRREQEEKDIDDTTGQKLFKPIINSTEKRATEANVWNILYSKNDAKKKELEDLQKEQLKQTEAASVAKKCLAESDKIFHDFRQRQYERLFNTLDSDGDGVISANAIRIDQIDVKALEILTPFFEELQTSEDALDFMQFCNKMDVLYKGLNVAQRSILLKKETKQETVEAERKPFISQTSVILAEKKRSSMPGDMYERLTAANKMTEMKVQKIKEEKEKEASKECTFRPSLKSN
ncbi:hypothetical protein SteCoe_1850 [Stentor coeruleus]|uniref:EF-hand domain-containing protein n=1 Tax=Stentor coeruleus TaxID=5963 RepID=A0A1R2D0R9_9CILI|nr:hypothetical protein SteCoe_1850 [Stentor coeruleus]